MVSEFLKIIKIDSHYVIPENVVHFALQKCTFHQMKVLLLLCQCWYSCEQYNFFEPDTFASYLDISFTSFMKAIKKFEKEGILKLMDNGKEFILTTGDIQL